ncbi:MAG TPA: ribosomal protein S18-alanine N-acetyltransferase [Mycobacteriales bacterium]|nr:ribosomal protein S18-alanine N-acetyltransferase [Mycobacteriales bacterium]
MRPMRWWDIEPVMVLERELFGDEAWTDSMYWSELAERDSRCYLVEEDDGRLVAWAGLCTYAPHEAYIQTIGVARAAQGRGLGTALLLTLLEEARRRGVAHVDLEVRADNDSARQLYEHHGFTQIAVRRKYYQPSGTDAIVMRHVLAERS